MDSKTLLELKKEYLQHLQDVLVEPFLNEFQTIYETTFKSTSSGKVLQEFQHNVSQVPQWNHIMIEAMFERVLEQSKCDFLGDLIRAIFVTYVRFNLASHGKLDNNNQVKIKVPNAANFVHKCLIACARVVWRQPYLFYHAVRTIERQHNRTQADDAFRKAIAATVRSSIPWDQLLNITVRNEKIEEDTESAIASTDDDGSDVSDEGIESDNSSQKSSSIDESNDDAESDSTFENEEVPQIEENEQSKSDSESESDDESQDEDDADEKNVAESGEEDETEEENTAEAGGEEDETEDKAEAEDEVENVAEANAEDEANNVYVVESHTDGNNEHQVIIATNDQIQSHNVPREEFDNEMGYDAEAESENDSGIVVVEKENENVAAENDNNSDDDELIQLTEADIPLIIADPEELNARDAEPEDDSDAHIVTIFKTDNDTNNPPTYVSSPDHYDHTVESGNDNDDQELKRTVIIDPKKIHKPKYAPKARITDAFF